MFFKTFVMMGLILAAAGCGRLPGGAPASEEVLKEVTEGTSDFALYSVSRAFLPTVAQWPATGKQERLSWISASTGARNSIIQPGDSLNIRIWDSSDNSLLTTAEQKDIELADMKVASNGDIFLPYVGNVSVIGLTPDLAREEVQTAFEMIVPSAQVQLAMTEGRNNSVDLVSGVLQPGTYPMPDRNYSVLGLISAGGGISANLNNPQIRLMRDGRIYGTSVDKLLNNPQLDTLLRGGDRVFLEEDERYFLSFGAAGREDLHIFTKDEMSAMDAVSIMGGIQDAKADPKGLLILREYPASATRAGVRGPQQTRVVFSVDLTTADGLFSARRFQINPDDLIMATESPINDALTVSNIIGNFFGVFSRAGAI
ncbi:polysaccharide biosynthesis/export family protein [Sedimentitalea sp. JM2-8]|uniref:Polysaccharide biosynthesis/export family protein n=1 Tax=Sedimentitalea xiamensis TaxID=3050037 RepID=A0ABT7FHD7_9RHOB|nr:polysaccharide biosynthesis/export family protein [Sedimentitalea xiamensis]MDK3074528.1 polysaccharide biosynthesis/export family protein [Sedimentitalea xiamensis]